MLKELSLEEIREAQRETFSTECEDILFAYEEMIKQGEKVMVKEKTTARGRSYVFYKYDKKLYRYQIVGEIFA